MNQLKIDISFNHNDAVKIHSDFSYDLDEFQDNGFFQVPMFSVELDNSHLYEEIISNMPIKIKINDEEYEKVLKIKTNCHLKNCRDSSGNDISKNNLYFGFDERAYLNDGNTGDYELKNYLDKIPDDILENNKNLLEIDLESEDLTDDIKEWKKNLLTLKPFFRTKLDGDRFFYLWLNNMGIETRREFKFRYNFLFYLGKELDLKTINIGKIVSFISFRKNLAKSIKVSSELAKKN